MPDAQQLPQAIMAPRKDLHPADRFLIYQAFVYGTSRPPVPGFYEGYLEKLAERGLITKLPYGEYKLTLAGVEDFTQRYLKEVADWPSTEEATINYFRCQFSERLRDGFEGPVIVSSNEAMINYVKLLTHTSHLSISERSREYDYAVLDFIDEYTGESHDLFPGDTVVLVKDGYVIHKFSE